MRHRKTYMYIIFFSKLGLLDHQNHAHKYICKKIASCINLQLPIVNFKKSVPLDMHHHKTYMYINFQQNRVNRSVKTVHTHLFANKWKLHKFATTNSNFEKKSIIWDMRHRKTYRHINFQQYWVNRSVITVHTNVFAKKIASYISLQLPIVIFKNWLFQTCVIVYQFSAKSGW